MRGLLGGGVKVYAFDVDDTLEVSNGPVTMASVLQLRQEGNIVGLCGNFEPVIRVLGQLKQHDPFSFVWLMDIPKESFLRALRGVLPAEDYVMVGNIFGLSGGSDDAGAAERAGFRFIKESDFAEGMR